MKKIIIIIFALITVAACSRKETLIGQNWDSEADGYELAGKYPQWISNPSMGGYIGAAGRGKSNIKGGLKTQRDIAATIARGRVIRKINILVNNVCNNIAADSIDKAIVSSYRNQIDCKKTYMRAELIRKIVKKGEWKNPKNGNIYVWLVLKK